MIWSNDGWCYIPQLSIRCKFTETSTIQEDWTGVIAMPEYVEHSTYEKPSQQKTSSPDTHKKTQRPRGQRQQSQLA